MKYTKYALMTLLIILLATAGTLASEVPRDLNGDKIVSVEEVATAEKLVQIGRAHV